MEHTQFITSLLTPRPGKVADRKVWSLGLFATLVPFFTATNADGVSAIPAEALGAPLRLQKEKDGTPKFSKSGRPVLRVVREIADQVRIMRENYDFSLQAYTDAVRKAKPAEYQAQVEANHRAGEPIAKRDTNTLTQYLELLAEARAEEEAKAKAAAEAETPVAEPKKARKRAKVLAQAEKVVAEAQAEKVVAEAVARELVPA